MKCKVHDCEMIWVEYGNVADLENRDLPEGYWRCEQCEAELGAIIEAVDSLSDLSDRPFVDDDDNGYLECEQEGWAE
jgi:hypothetical protein